MKSLLFLISVLWLHNEGSSFSWKDWKESSNTRVKRADCSSKFGDWSEWSTCSMNCGYCGKQNRTRTCQAVTGCAEPVCDGDSVETQDCGETNEPLVCLYPSISCCKSEYKKMIDFVGKRFYCGLRNSTQPTPPPKTTTTSS